MNELAGMRVAMLVGPRFEDSEAVAPYYRLKEAGAEVTVVGLTTGTVEGKHGVPMRVELAAADARSEDFDALVLPGGQGPDTLRAHEAPVNFVRGFVAAGKPIGAICHGPQLLISARGVQGARVTAWKSVWDDLRNAGASVVDEPVVVDREHHLVTSRHPGDIPAFDAALVEFIATRSPSRR